MTENFKFSGRRIVKMNQSYFVILPISWVRHHALQKGEELTPHMNQKGELVLCPATKKAQS